MNSGGNFSHAAWHPRSHRTPSCIHLFLGFINLTYLYWDLADMELVSILFTGSVRHLENIGFYLELSQSAFQVWVKPKSEDLWLGKKKRKKRKKVWILMRGTLFCSRLTFLSVKLHLYTPELLAEIETILYLMILAERSQLNKEHLLFLYSFYE